MSSFKTLSLFHLPKIDSSFIYIYYKNLGELLFDLKELEFSNKAELVEAANSNKLEQCKNLTNQSLKLYVLYTDNFFIHIQSLYFKTRLIKNIYKHYNCFK